MAKKNWGTMRPGREDRSDFSKLVSPVGSDGAETPQYSPAAPVTGSKTHGYGRASQSESARNERRGG